MTHDSLTHTLASACTLSRDKAVPGLPPLLRGTPPAASPQRAEVLTRQPCSCGGSELGEVTPRTVQSKAKASRMKGHPAKSLHRGCEGLTRLSVGHHVKQRYLCKEVCAFLGYHIDSETLLGQRSSRLVS